MKKVLFTSIIILLLIFCGCNINNKNKITDQNNIGVEAGEPMEKNIPFVLRKEISYAIDQQAIAKMFGNADETRVFEEYFYEIRNKNDGSKVFYFYSNNDIIYIWRLKELLVKNDFSSIKLNESSYEDVLKIDPYALIIELTEDTAISEHLLVENELADIEYYKRDNKWIVKNINYNDNQFKFTSKLKDEDLSKILPHE